MCQALFPIQLVTCEKWVVLKNTGWLLLQLLGSTASCKSDGQCNLPKLYALSPRMRRASWMSLGMMVTRLAWMAARLVSSNRPTR